MRALSLLVILMTYQISLAQDTKEILDSQVKAFNEQNIEGLLANLDDDFGWYYVTPDGLVTEVEGKKAFQKGMESYYEQYVKVYSEMIETTVLGDKISFKERVEWSSSGGKSGAAEALGVYQFRDGKIWRVWYF